MRNTWGQADDVFKCNTPESKFLGFPQPDPIRSYSMLQLGVRDTGLLTPTVPDELGNAKKEQKNDLGALKC